MIAQTPSRSVLSTKSSALVAGISLLVMAILAPIANFVILQGLVDPSDAELTLANITASGGTFRLAIFLFMVVAVLDIVVAWALYIFLEPVDRSLSLLTAWLRVVYAAVLLVALVSLVKVTVLLGGTIAPDLFLSGQTASQVMLSLEMFNRGWEFGLTVFGLHLLVLGYLLLKAGFMKKILGILVILAGVGYTVDGLGKVLVDGYSLGISMYTFIGELVLLVWLLVWGWRVRPATS
jgi:hypothetical protein